MTQSTQTNPLDGDLAMYHVSCRYRCAIRHSSIFFLKVDGENFDYSPPDIAFKDSFQGDGLRLYAHEVTVIKIRNIPWHIVVQGYCR